MNIFRTITQITVRFNASFCRETCSLRQLIDFENVVAQERSTLRSDMQTFVYDNYNKFISATDIVKKMKTDFKKVEDEMSQLSTNMKSITSFSDSISSKLQDSRDQIYRLSGIHSLLKKLQFLFKLPNKLRSQMNCKNYSKAVQDYLYIQSMLEQYGSLESLQGIQQECIEILEEVKLELQNQSTNSLVNF